MAQVKIFGLRRHLETKRPVLSGIIQACLGEAFGLPETKKFQRFFLMDEADFIFPESRSDRYTLIEISCFEGRSLAAKEHLYTLLFDNMEALAGIPRRDLEIVLIETPQHNWGIRGKPGHTLELSYTVTV